MQIQSLRILWGAGSVSEKSVGENLVNKISVGANKVSKNSDGYRAPTAPTPTRTLDHVVLIIRDARSSQQKEKQMVFLRFLQ